jgi:hypothetical protein
MGLTNQISTAIAAQAAGVAGMVGGSATPLDTIPNTPYAVVGPSSGRIDQPGSWERLYWTVPWRCYVARISNGALVQTDVNDLLDLILVTFRTGITLGGLVSQSVIATWQTDRYYTVGIEDYQAIDFVNTVELERSASYTA